jgi:hypothetical protein
MASLLNEYGPIAGAVAAPLVVNMVYFQRPLLSVPDAPTDFLILGVAAVAGYMIVQKINQVQ